MRKKFIILALSIIFLSLVVLLGLYIKDNIDHPRVLKCSINPSQVTTIYMYDDMLRYADYNEFETKEIISYLNKINLKKGNYDKGYVDYISDNCYTYFKNSSRIELLNKDRKVIWSAVFISRDKDSNPVPTYNGKIINQNFIYYNGCLYPDTNSEIDFTFFKKSKFLSPAYHKALD